MIKGRKWLYAVRRQLIQQPVVEIEALWVWRASGQGLLVLGGLLLAVPDWARLSIRANVLPW